MESRKVTSESVSTPAQGQANRGRRRKLNDLPFTSSRLKPPGRDSQQPQEPITRWLDNAVQPANPKKDPVDDSAWGELMDAIQQAIAPVPYSNGKQTITPKKTGPAPLSLGAQGQDSLPSPNSDIFMQNSDAAYIDTESLSPTRVQGKAVLQHRIGNGNDLTSPSHRGNLPLATHSHNNGLTGGIMSPPLTPVTARQVKTGIGPPAEFARIMSNKGNRDADPGVTSVLSFPRGMLRRKRALYEAATVVDAEPPTKKIRATNDVAHAGDDSAILADAADTQPPVMRTEANNGRAHATAEPTVAVAQDGFTGVPFLFTTISLEVRDMIYGYLLESDEPIRVMKHWTLRYARCRPGIHPAVLRVCKQAYAEAIRVLYGKNTFQYLLRDTSDAGPLPWVPRGRSRRVQPVFHGPSDGQFIDVYKHGNLLRRLEIVVEANRTGEEYKACMEMALMALSPEVGGFDARLHTITLTVFPRFEEDFRLVTSTVGEKVPICNGRRMSVVDFFSSGGKIVKTLEKINVDYVRINVHTEGFHTHDAAQDHSEDDDDDDDDDWPDDHSSPDVNQANEGSQPMEGKIIREGELEDSGPRNLETTIDLRYLPCRIAALKAASGGVWLEDDIAIKARTRRGEEGRMALKRLRLHVEKAVTQPTKSICNKLWEERDEATARRREKSSRVLQMLIGDDNPPGVVVEDDHSDEASDHDEESTLIMKFTRCNNNRWAARVA